MATVREKLHRQPERLSSLREAWILAGSEPVHNEREEPAVPVETTNSFFGGWRGKVD